MASSEDQIVVKHEEDPHNACDYQTLSKESLIEMLKEKDKLLIEKTQTISRLERELVSLKGSKGSQNNNEVCNVHSYGQYSTQTLQDPHSKSALSGIKQENDDGEKPMPDWTESSSGLTNIESSISDVVRATAEAEMGTLETEQVDNSEKTGNSEYVYDESSGYYYHPATGYYWDPNSRLFYDYTSGMYYQYNESSGEYEVHSQVDIQAGNIMAKETKTKHTKNATTLKNLKTLKKGIMDKKRRRIKRKAVEASSSIKGTKRADHGNKDLPSNEGLNPSTDVSFRISDDESSGSLATDESELVSDPESGEIVSSSSSDSDVQMVGVELAYNEQPLSPAVEQAQDQSFIEAMAENYPPCIRAIIEESDKLSAGTLFIITCTGGTIGRDSGAKHIVEIPDSGVSKIHAKIDYDYDHSCYQVTDLGSQNGTRVNGDWVGQDKSKSRSHFLKHGDLLQLGGSTKLLVHIHKGYETCEGCEPGQIQAKLKAANPLKNTHVVLSKEEKKLQQRRELKKIKKKFGLQNSYFENEVVRPTDSHYLDKAYLRRKFVGSENEAIGTKGPASVHCPIEASNKGHQLLSKMGWTEGQGLGKASSGIAEPINVEMRVNQNAGLGSRDGVAVSLDRVQDSNKAKRWSQARQRFNNLQTSADQTTGQGQGLNSQATSTKEENKEAASHVEISDSGVSSSISSSSSSSTTISSSKSPRSQPQILWHKGGTETFSNNLLSTESNKDS